jgi:hypothetical protein
MLRFLLLLGAVLTLAPATSAAQDSTAMRRHQPGVIDTNRIGVMSPMVVQQRLRMLGYANVTLLESARRSVRANASKSGRPVAVHLDPFTGKVTEAPGRLERARDGLRLVRPDGSIATPPR